MVIPIPEVRITPVPLIIVGFLMGAMSWGVVSLVSNRFEPFDSSLGFYIGQSVLSATTLFIGFRLGFRALCIFISCAYFGMNTYAYLFGSSDNRALALLGLIVSLTLVVFPALSGLLGYITGRVISRFRQPTTKQG
jgi:hypothetical protein